MLTRINTESKKSAAISMYVMQTRALPRLENMTGLASDFCVG